MTQEEAHKQVLLMDEADVYTLFSKSKLAETKSLLEGRGMLIENKGKDPFHGFKGSFILLTCNELPCPLGPPVNSSSGFDRATYEREQRAFMGRCEMVELTKGYDNSKGVNAFPFTA